MAAVRAHVTAAILVLLLVVTSGWAYQNDTSVTRYKVEGVSIPPAMTTTLSLPLPPPNLHSRGLLPTCTDERGKSLS